MTTSMYFDKKLLGIENIEHKWATLEILNHKKILFETPYPCKDDFFQERHEFKFPAKFVL